MENAFVKELGRRIEKETSSVIVGCGPTIRLVLATLFAGGHVLMEDVPGTGKTLLCRTIAACIDVSFARIQFTPDLLPSDITGMSVYRQDTGDFRFLPGPVFTGFLLADEINRAVPRTQSALLECMEERQVTEGGVSRPLPSPFMVLATQNPVENRGTFPLPEAQLDRFMVRLKMGYPDHDGSMTLLGRFLNGETQRKVSPVSDGGEVLRAVREASGCRISEVCADYIVRIVEETRNSERVELGASGRGMLALASVARAYASLDGRNYVIPDDIKYLAPYVLSHRLIMRSGEDPDTFVREILGRIWAPTENDR
ncbi:MAG: MoxR family ATPase [Clostridia bacterium]|nr:MoxR family ATPase [Clostridia bacterium]